MLIPIQLLSYAFYASAVLLLLYRALWKESSNLYPLAIAVVASFLLFAFEHAQLPLLLSGVVIFNSVSFTLERKLGMLMVLLGVAYAGFYVYSGYSALLLAQAIFIGLLVYPKHFTMRESKKDNKEVERKRDIFQATAGVVILAAFMLLSAAAAYYFLILLILVGYLFRSFVVVSGGNALAKYLAGLEREGAPFGKGAIWLALGSLLTLSFVSPVALVIPVLAAILIADPLATIIGIKAGGYKLPYNRQKTISGFLTYFVVVFAFSFLFARQFSIFIAIVAAVVESLPLHIDDNLDVPLFLAIMLKLAFL